jgi:hypothetical protein
MTILIQNEQIRIDHIIEVTILDIETNMHLLLVQKTEEWDLWITVQITTLETNAHVTVENRRVEINLWI